MNVKVQTEPIADATFSPATESSPWTVEVPQSSCSPELSSWLTNPDGYAGVEVDIEGVPNTGQARINMDGSSFLLIGRGDLTPIA